MTEPASPGIEELRAEVTDETSLLTFLDALATEAGADRRMREQGNCDAYGRTELKWEHGTIEGFLDAAHAWATASQNGLIFYEPPSNPWRRIADILMMGKVYE